MTRAPVGPALPVATGVILLAVWEAAWRLRVVDPLFFSGPSAVATTLVRLVATGEILPHYASTLGSAAIGLTFAVACGIATGIAFGLSPGFRVLAGPYVALLNATPRVAMIGLFVVWLGLGLGVRIAMVAISAFFPVFFNTAEGVRALDSSLDRVGRAYGCTRWEWFTRILVPYALPYMLTGIQMAIGRSLVVIVIAEIFVGSLGGIGYFVINAGQQFDSARVFAGAALMAGTGLVLTAGLRALGAWLMPWHPRKPI